MNAIYPFIGAALAVGVLIYLALSILLKKIPPTSPASWLMWTVLDSLLAITSFIAAPSQLGWLMPAGWVLGALLCTVATFVRGRWTWGYGESLCAVSASVAAYYWLTTGAVAGVVAGTIAMTVAGIPLLVEMTQKPVRGTFIVWLVTVLACSFMLLGSDMTLVGMFLPVGSFLYNAALALLVLRPARS